MKVIKSETLSEEFEPRYICIDEETGEVLDDAQGYGFKSPQKAHTCYAYKNRTNEQKQEHERKLSEIKKFMNETPLPILEDIDNMVFYGIKDGFTSKEINEGINDYLDTIGFDFKEKNITKKFFINHI